MSLRILSILFVFSCFRIGLFGQVVFREDFASNPLGNGWGSEGSLLVEHDLAGGEGDGALVATFNQSGIPLPLEGQFFTDDSSGTKLLRDYQTMSEATLRFGVLFESRVPGFFGLFMSGSDSNYAAYYVDVKDLQTGVWHSISVNLKDPDAWHYESRAGFESVLSSPQMLSWFFFNSGMGREAYRFDYVELSGAGSEAVVVPSVPVPIGPVNGATNVSMTTLLTASAYQHNAGRAHAASQWQVARDFSSGLIWDSGTNAAGTSITVPENVLTNGVEYQWRVRYRDDQGAWSWWSVAFQFTTLSVAGGGGATNTDGGATGGIDTGSGDNGGGGSIDGTTDSGGNGGDGDDASGVIDDGQSGDNDGNVTDEGNVENTSDDLALYSPANGTTSIYRRISFSWPFVASATWYRVQLDLNGALYSREWVNATNVWKPLEDLAPGSYTWRVQGWGDAAGHMAWSPELHFKILGGGDPGVQPMYPLTPQDAPDIVYRWSAILTAGWYNLQVERVGFGIWHDKWYVNDSPFDCRGFVTEHPSGTYRWRVRSWSDRVMGPWSEAVTFTIQHQKDLRYFQPSSYTNRNGKVINAPYNPAYR